MERCNERIIVIGASTGGPHALQDVVTRLPSNLPCSVLVVQHMPSAFTKKLAERLDALAAVCVKEAQHGECIFPAHVYIAPGGYHMTVESSVSRSIICLNTTAPLAGHRPAVDPLFESVAAMYGRYAIGVILTGMGRDGTRGMAAIWQQGGHTIAEDESTAAVFGMPKSAIEAGVVVRVLPVQEIAAHLVKTVIK